MEKLLTTPYLNLTPTRSSDMRQIVVVVGLYKSGAYNIKATQFVMLDRMVEDAIEIHESIKINRRSVRIASVLSDCDVGEAVLSRLKADINKNVAIYGDNKSDIIFPLIEKNELFKGQKIYREQLGCDIRAYLSFDKAMFDVYVPIVENINHVKKIAELTFFYRLNSSANIIQYVEKSK
jgi:hypothetical protein